MGDVIEILTTATNTVEVEAQGPQGIPGVGVPTGGSTGQVLRKASAADYATEWAAAGSGSGSVTSVALASSDFAITGSPITDAGTITANLGNTGVTAGTYTKVTVDSKGRVTNGDTVAASDISGLGTSSTADIGTGAGDVCAADDSRLSDSRSPTAHAISHQVNGSDAVPCVTQALQLGDNGNPDPNDTATIALKYDSSQAAGSIWSVGDKYEFRDEIEAAALSHTHTAADIDSQTASNGTVLTANGSGGASFAALPASGISAIGASAADVFSVGGTGNSELVADDPNADRIIFFDDSAGKLTHLTVGSGLSLTDTTLTATASGGSKTYAVFSATDNQPPSTAFATLDTRNSIAVLDFDDATDESAVFVSVMPEGASLGSGLKIRLHWMATSATSGNCVWDVSLERMTTDLDSDSFDTIASATAAANGTSGILTVTEITLTTIDSVTAGDGFRLKVTRDANNGSDTMTGDAELVVCEVRSAA